MLLIITTSWNYVWKIICHFHNLPLFFFNYHFITGNVHKWFFGLFWPSFDDFYTITSNFLDHWTMSVMVKYRAALWSFLKFTALVFYHVWHSPYGPLHTYLKIRRYWYLEYYLISLAKLLLYKGLNPLCDIEVSVNNRKSRKLTRHILIASVNMKPQYYFLF